MLSLLEATAAAIAIVVGITQIGKNILAWWHRHKRKKEAEKLLLQKEAIVQQAYGGEKKE